jgi:hypothetical protein
MKDYSGAKHSNAPVTPDCESVNHFNQLNLLPAQTEIRQESGAGNASSVNGDSDSITCHENEQTITDSSSCIAIGNDANGSTVSNQTNHVQENRGVTGITGTGHTINIYQCPQELINLLVKTLRS